jgi:6-phosphogluconate dehydrogenase
MDTQYDFAMIGLGVMGSNLLYNMADNGFAVIGYDLDAKKSAALEQSATKGTTVKGVNTLPEMVSALKKPRKILMLVPAGKPVDIVIQNLLPLVEEGDIIIDGGNSYFQDTLRRVEELKEKKMHFFGMGVSGGEAGARFGPSMMPGGDRATYEYLKPILEAIAAKADGVPCVAFMGNGAAGHYVKMVHNGIEYAMMQMISEVYDFLHRGCGFSTQEIQQVFEKWNEGQLKSFLISITGTVLKTVDQETGKPLVEMILDKAGSKGTGKWTSQESMNLPVAIPTIDAAVAARTLSGYKEEREAVAKLFAEYERIVEDQDRELILNMLEDTLSFAFVMAYTQGLSMLSKASVELSMEIPLPAVIQVWKAGCIIRSELLVNFQKAFEQNSGLTNLLLDQGIAALLQEKETAVRKLLIQAIQARIPMPGIMSTVGYFDSYTSERMPTNLIQAQRDFFGAHTYQRIDKPGIFHTEWEE